MKLAIRLLINEPDDEPGLSYPLIGALDQVFLRVLVKGLLTGNTTEVVFLLHSATPFYGDPINRTYIEALGYKRLAGVVLIDHGKHPRWPYITPPQFVLISSDDAEETVPVVEPLSLREAIVASNFSGTLSFTAPSTTPEDVVEVWP